MLVHLGLERSQPIAGEGTLYHKRAADLMHMHVSVGPVRCANDKPMRQLQQQQLTQQQKQQQEEEQQQQQQRQIAIEVNFSKLHAKMC